MALRLRLIADPHEVLRIIDDMEDSELSNEDDSETDEEAEISLAVTPVHSDSETETIDSIDPIPSGSGVVSTVVAAATSGNLHPESSSDTDSYSGQQQGVARLTRSKARATATTGRPRRGRATASKSRRGRDRSPIHRGRGRGHGRPVARPTVRTPSRDRGWSNVFTPRQNTVPFSGNVGPTFRRNRLPDDVRPIDVFELFFDGDVIDLFVEQTNANRHRKKAAQPHQHKTPWTDTTSREMKAFFGIVISMGIVRLPKLRDYWRQKQWLFRMPSFAEVMPRD